MRRLAEALDLARSSRSRIAKEKAIASALAAIGKDEDDRDGVALATAARMAIGRTLPAGDGRTLGVGWSLVMDVAEGSSGFPKEIVRACAGKTGDLGEALGLLAARVPGVERRPGLALREVAALFDTLAAAGQRATKRRALDDAFAKATALETKFLAKAVLGALRVGAQAGVMEGAIARAFGVEVDEVRRAAALVTDAGELAVLARDGRLGEARLELGRPVAFMLATPLETLAALPDPALYVMEDKIDGVRSQLHKFGGEVALFARGLDRVTAAFPEIVDAFRFVPGGVVLDGEIVAALPDGKPRPFQALQARLRKKTPGAVMLAETPVTFVAYDILSDGERDLLAEPWSVRRASLERFARERGPRAAFAVNPVAPMASPSTSTSTPPSTSSPLDLAFAAARARGYEGLVLKRIDAPYDAGRRGQAWIKIKRAFATLDVVVTAAEEGHGRRAGVLSDYTFGVWRGDELVNVGKAYSGLTDDEIDAMNKKLERLTLEKLGHVRLVRPEIVLEVAFDGVQPSARHKSGFALRFPRIVRVRDDKLPADADRLEAVEALFRMQVATGHREAPAPAVVPKARRGARGPDANQLGLFDAPQEPPRK